MIKITVFIKTISKEKSLKIYKFITFLNAFNISFYFLSIEMTDTYVKSKTVSLHFLYAENKKLFFYHAYNVI